MKGRCLLLLVYALSVTFQLSCDRREVTGTVGSNLHIRCLYPASFLFSKKYWCRGGNRDTCEILMDSEASPKGRVRLFDRGRKGLHIIVEDLRFQDAGKYWVGIDIVLPDIMTPVKVVVTEVPVSEPRVWLLDSVGDRPTCRGQPVTVSCACKTGTGVHYKWHRLLPAGAALFKPSSDLPLHCGALQGDARFFCTASNDVSSKRSGDVSVRVLRAGARSCIYVVDLPGQLPYDCGDTTTESGVATRNQSAPVNETGPEGHFTFGTGVPLWCNFLRWCSFASLLLFLATTMKRSQNIGRKKYTVLERRRRHC